MKSISVGIADEVTSLTFFYDDARRLTRIKDALENEIEYILDSEGNIEQENITDEAGVLVKTLSQTFDVYNRLDTRAQVNEVLDQLVSSEGNIEQIQDGENVVTTFEYDDLKRLTRMIDDYAGTDIDTRDATTQFIHDLQDNLVSVEDPVDGTTLYSYDDLGNLLSIDSPDSGLTQFTHDAAGNVLTRLDAENQQTTYTHDALGRILSVSTSNSEDDIQYEYDSCQNGVGRLCKIMTSGSTQYYNYDAFGNVTAHQALQYTFDTANRLKTVIYPSGAMVDYGFDAAGQVDTVSLTRNGTTLELASSVIHEPFGDVKAISYGNGLNFSQNRDLAYRMDSQNIPGIYQYDYSQYDANGNLQQRIDHLAGETRDYQYDALQRLESSNDAILAESYGYDKNGNRTQLTQDTVPLDYDYDVNTNRMSQLGSGTVTLDANGNTTDIGSRHYDYSRHNRLFEVYEAGVHTASYRYNGLGQRISKTWHGGGVDGKGRHFLYAPDGKLMAELDQDGNVLYEYIYLDQQLLAVYSPDSDADGISNMQEDGLASNPVSIDSDGDGIADSAEIFTWGTHHLVADTDGDGIDDGDEQSFNSNPRDADISYGDVSLDGAFNAGDLVILIQIALGTRSFNAAEFTNADVNQDGAVDTRDVLLMQRVLLGINISWLDLPGNVIAWIKDILASPVIAANGDGDNFFVHNDHLGTPQLMTNESGLVVWKARYRAFGEANVDEDVDGDNIQVELNIRFPGQYYDNETGLHYNYFRYYDPKLGRYITSDPIGLAGGLNTYAYSLNNPIMRYDPNGLVSIHSIVAGIGTISTLITAHIIYSKIRDFTDKQQRTNEILGDPNKILNNANELQDYQRGLAPDMIGIHKEATDLATSPVPGSDYFNLKDNVIKIKDKLFGQSCE